MLKEGASMDTSFIERTEELIKTLRLNSTPVAMQFYDSAEALNSIPKLRKVKEGEIHTACQLIGQAVRQNFTVGFTADSMSSSQCSGVCALCQRELFSESDHLKGVWYGTTEDALKHQRAMNYLDHVYQAVAVSPIVSNRLPAPNVYLIYATPQQVQFMCNAYQYKDYEEIRVAFVGESSCSDSWTAALRYGKPCVSIPCFAERRFGGVQDDEMSIAFPPRYLPKIVDGLRQLSQNGFRYPISAYGLQHDVRAGLGVSYDTSKLRSQMGK